MVGEQGNSGPRGKYSNWLPDSALRLLIRTWTAFFKEVSLVFWDTSYATNGNGGGAANIYLGLEERTYVSVLQWFSNMVIRAETNISNVRVSDSSLIRAYGLTSNDGVAIYAHHYTDHANTVSGKTITIDVPLAGQAYWIDPASGRNLGSVGVSQGRNTLIVPNFTIDIAFFSTAVVPPQISPVAILTIGTPQADGDPDNDGLLDFGPSRLPFGTPPLTLNFDGRGSYDLDGGALNYIWRFGDGSPDEVGSVSVVSHTYSSGTYLTNLTVIDDEGKSASQSFVVRATGDLDPNNNNVPVLNGLRDMTVHEGQLVLITPLASDNELVKSGVEGQYIKDNLTYSVTGLPNGASFGQRGATWSNQFWWVPSFSQSGIYMVEFKVQDDDGFSDVEGVHITVLDAPPTSP